MAVQVLLPRLGFAMEEGRLVSWLVADGSEVAEGSLLYEVELDKTVQEVEAPASGTLRILAAVDQTYKVGDLLAEIL